MATRFGGSPFSGDTAEMPSWYRDSSAPTPNKPMRVGAVALIERGDSLLVERRADDGTWGLVAGALEKDESITEALSREIREETGLETQSVELFGVFSDLSRIVGYEDGNVYRVSAVVFRVSVSAGDPRLSDEATEMRFVARDKLRELELTPAHRPIVERYLADPSEVILE